MTADRPTLTPAQMRDHMLRCLNEAEKARLSVLRRRTQLAHAIIDERAISGQPMPDKHQMGALIETDKALKTGIGDNRWYIDQATMWAVALQAEIAWEEGNVA